MSLKRLIEAHKPPTTGDLKDAWHSSGINQYYNEGASLQQAMRADLKGGIDPMGKLIKREPAMTGGLPTGMSAKQVIEKEKAKRKARTMGMKKGGKTKMACGGKTKMARKASGGLTCRGGGCATRGTKFSRNG